MPAPAAQTDQSYGRPTAVSLPLQLSDQFLIMGRRTDRGSPPLFLTHCPH